MYRMKFILWVWLNAEENHTNCNWLEYVVYKIDVELVIQAQLVCKMNTKLFVACIWLLDASHTVVSFFHPTHGMCRIRHILAYSQRAHTPTDRYTHVCDREWQHTHTHIQSETHMRYKYQYEIIDDIETETQPTESKITFLHIHSVTSRISEWEEKWKKTENKKEQRERIQFQWTCNCECDVIIQCDSRIKRCTHSQLLH